MRPLKIGDKVRILDGILLNARGYVSYINKEKNTITVMIPAKQIHPKDRHRFIVKRTRYGAFVPLTVAEGEWELYGARTIDIPKPLRGH